MSEAKDTQAAATRENVSKAYAEAVSRPAGGCCGGGAPCGETAKLAGYGANELNVLPQDAVEHSFGCGNPLAFSQVQAGEVVLDLGSGAGMDLILASQKVGPRGRAIGVDMTDEMIAHARHNLEKAGAQNAEVRKGIIEKLPVDSSSVDWVISNCVINLSPEKPKVFGEIARVLRPGGRFSISDIVARDLPAWALQSKDLYSACVAGAVSEKDYLSGLEAAGLEGARVVARQVYDASQIRSFLLSGEFGKLPDGLDPQALAKALEGKVWSAQFEGTKAGGKYSSKTLPLARVSAAPSTSGCCGPSGTATDAKESAPGASMESGSCCGGSGAKATPASAAEAPCCSLRAALWNRVSGFFGNLFARRAAGAG